MATTTEPRTDQTAEVPRVEHVPEQRIILTGISWATYQKLSEEVGDRAVLKSYNRGVLELMSPEAEHEDYKNRLRRLIDVLTEELGIPCYCLGSTTWKDEEAERGVESDECYLLTEEKVTEVARMRPKKARETPRPDLAVEVDMSRPAVDRSEIYATLGVPEVWRFDGDALRIDRLRDDGTYEPAAASRFLPIPPAEVVRWVVREEAADNNAWARRLRAWVRATLVPPPAENG